MKGRLRYYRAMMADPDVLRSHVWAHTMALLAHAGRMTVKTAPATMESCAEAVCIPEMRSLFHTFDMVAPGIISNAGSMILRFMR